MTTTSSLLLLRPTLEDCQRVRVWRNDPAVLPILRTGAKTVEEQTAFHQGVVLNPCADHWYYSLVDEAGQFVAFGGLTYLSRQPGEAEISLIVNPACRSQGLGATCVAALLARASERGLRAVIGECYLCGAVSFWERIVSQCGGTGLRWGISYFFRFDL